MTSTYILRKAYHIFLFPLLTVWTGCTWNTGDGISKEKINIGSFSGPKECVDKCKVYIHNGRRPNGATVDADIGRTCYCQIDATGRTSSSDLKTCIFAPGIFSISLIISFANLHLNFLFQKWLYSRKS